MLPNKDISCIYMSTKIMHSCHRSNCSNDSNVENENYITAIAAGYTVAVGAAVL